MLLLLSVIAVVGTYKLSKTEYYKNSYLDMVLFIVDFLIGFITFCIIIAMVSYFPENAKVKLYEQENVKIERKIDLLAKNYMDHESDFYKNFKQGDGVVLVETYPELKGNELIKEQIRLYEKNNNKLLEVKQGEIYLNTCKWLLYFGGKR